VNDQDPIDPAKLADPEAQFGGGILAMTTTGNRLWIAQGPSIRAVDPRASGRPRFSSPSLRLDATVTHLVAQGPLGLARSGDALHLIDLEGAQGPRVRSRIDLTILDGARGPILDCGPGPIALMAPEGADGAWLAVAAYRPRSDDGKMNVAIFELNGHLAARDILESPVVIRDMVADGDLLALSVGSKWESESNAGIRIFKATSAAVTELIRWDEPAAGKLVLRQVGHQRLLYSFSPDAMKLAVWDLSDPAAPSELARWEGPFASQPTGSHESRHSLAVTDAGQIFVKLRLSEAGTDQDIVVRLPWPGTSEAAEVIYRSAAPLWAPLRALGSQLLLAEESGLLAIDPERGEGATLASAMALGHVAMGEIAGTPVLFAASSSGLAAYTDLESADPKLVADLNDRPGSEISVGGGLVAMASELAGSGAPSIRIIDADASTGLVPRSEIDLGGAPASRFAQAGRLLVSRVRSEGRSEDDEIGLWDLVDPTDPVRRDRLRLPGRVTDLDIDPDGRRVAVTHELPERAEAIDQRIVGLSLLAIEGDAAELRLRLLGTLDLGPEQDSNGSLPLVALDGSTAWLVRWAACRPQSELSGVNIVDPEHLRPYPGSLASAALPKPVDIRLAGGHAFLPRDDSFTGAVIIHDQCLNPWMPQAGRTSIVDLRQAEAPRLVGEIPAGHWSVAIHKHRVYAADGYLGIYRFAPELAWSDEPGLPSPSPPPSPTPGPSTTPACPPTYTPLPSPEPSPSPSASSPATAVVTPGAEASPTWAPRLYLPFLQQAGGQALPAAPGIDRPGFQGIHRPVKASNSRPARDLKRVE
jgi:hypothetical protein